MYIFFLFFFFLINKLTANCVRSFLFINNRRLVIDLSRFALEVGFALRPCMEGSEGGVKGVLCT